MKIYILRVKTSSKLNHTPCIRDLGVYDDSKLLEDNILGVISMCYKQGELFLGWKIVDYYSKEKIKNNMFIYKFSGTTDKTIHLVSNKKDVSFGAVKPMIYKAKLNTYFYI